MSVLELPGCDAPQAFDRGLRLRPGRAALVRALECAEALAAAFGLSAGARHDFKLAASEAVANAIEHGQPCRDGTIHVWTRRCREGITFGVRNAGEFVFEPSDGGALAERGRGLTLMSALVDEVALRRVEGQVEVRLSIWREMQRHSGESSPPAFDAEAD